MTKIHTNDDMDVDWWNVQEHPTGKRQMFLRKSFIQLLNLSSLDAEATFCQPLEPLQSENDPSNIFSPAEIRRIL